MAIMYLGDGNASGDGVSMGQTASEKAGMHGTVADQAAAITSVATTAATNSSPYGYAEAQANAIVTAVNAILVALREKGIIAS